MRAVQRPGPQSVQLAVPHVRRQPAGPLLTGARLLRERPATLALRRERVQVRRVGVRGWAARAAAPEAASPCCCNSKCRQRRRRLR